MPSLPRVHSEIHRLAELYKTESFQREMGMINPEDGRLLRFWVEIMGAQRVLEIGTGAGLSALYIASGLLRTGGRLVTLEGSPEKARVARETLRRANLDGCVTAIEADALEALPGLAGPFDVVFLDAAKSNNIHYFDLVMPKVRMGGLILADDVSSSENVKMRDFLDMLKVHPGLETSFVGSVFNPRPGCNYGDNGLSVSRKTSSEWDRLERWVDYVLPKTVEPPPRPAARVSVPFETLLTYGDDFGCRSLMLKVRPGLPQDSLEGLCSLLLEGRGRLPYASIHIYDDREAFDRRDDFDYPPGDYFRHLVAHVYRHPRAGYDEIRLYRDGVLLRLPKPLVDPVHVSAQFGASPYLVEQLYEASRD